LPASIAVVRALAGKAATAGGNVAAIDMACILLGIMETVARVRILSSPAASI